MASAAMTLDPLVLPMFLQPASWESEPMAHGSVYSSAYAYTCRPSCPLDLSHNIC